MGNQKRQRNVYSGRMLSVSVGEGLKGGLIWWITMVDYLADYK